MFKKIYLIIGILTVLIFIATGQYLLRAFPDKEKLDLKEGEINIKIAEGFRIIQSGPVDKDETLLLKNEIIPDFKRPFLSIDLHHYLCKSRLNLYFPKPKKLCI